MTVIEGPMTSPGLTGPEPARPDDQGAGAPRSRRVVWKFGGTSVGDADRLRAVARRLVAARRQGTQVVAVLSAMGGTTDELVQRPMACPPSRSHGNWTRCCRPVR